MEQNNHTHDGINSPSLDLSESTFKIMASAPTKDAPEGTVILQNNGTDTFKIYVRINKSWKSATLS